MTWKIERWLSDVFPGTTQIYEEYRHLTRRELAIIAAGVLDLALAQLLSMRLRNYPAECEAFLGLNGDGRAPAGSFGARIQLALLTGLITEQDASLLRIAKNIRNAFAHRIKVEFTNQQVLILTRRLCDEWETRSAMLFPSANGKTERADGIQQIRECLEDEPEAGAGLLLAVFTTYQAYFHKLSDLVTPIQCVVSKTNK